MERARMRGRIAVVGALAVAVLASAAPAGAAKVSAADRRAIDSVVDRFVVGAVKRDHPVAAWSVVTPTLRGGTTRRDWAHGNIPVYPYAARGRTFHNWQVAWSRANDVGLDLTLFPVRRERKKIGPVAFGLALKRIHGRWLVDGFYPEATFAPQGSKPAVTSGLDFSSRAGNDSVQPALLGGAWWIVLIAALALAPVAAATAGVILLVRHRRHRPARARRGSLPPLPTRMQDRTSVGK